jgi:hypothetical protein
MNGDVTPRGRPRFSEQFDTSFEAADVLELIGHAEVGMSQAQDQAGSPCLNGAS